MISGIGLPCRMDAIRPLVGRHGGENSAVRSVGSSGFWLGSSAYALAIRMSWPVYAVQRSGSG